MVVMTEQFELNVRQKGNTAMYRVSHPSCHPPKRESPRHGAAEVELLSDDLRLFFGKSMLTLATVWLILDTLGKSWLFSG